MNGGLRITQVWPSCSRSSCHFAAGFFSHSQLCPFLPSHLYFVSIRCPMAFTTVATWRDLRGRWSGLGMLWDGLYRNRWFMMIHNCSCWKWWVGSKSSGVLFHLFLRVSQTMLWFLVTSYHHPPAPPWDIGMAPPQSMFQCLPGLEKNSAWLAKPKVENDWDTFLKIGDGWKILLKWDRFKVGFQKEKSR